MLNIIGIFPNASYNIPGNSPFVSKLYSSGDLIIFMITFKSLFENTNAVVLTPNILSWIAASVADAAAANLNGIKTLLANGLSTFFIKGKPVFSNGRRSLPKSPPDCLILCNWVFDDFTSAEEPFETALRSFETCLLVNNNLCGKLFPSLEQPTTFNKNFKVTSTAFFISDFNLLSCEVTFKV